MALFAQPPTTLLTLVLSRVIHGHRILHRHHRPLRVAVTPLQKESQVRFEIPEEIPVEHEYMRQMLPENQKIKKF